MSCGASQFLLFGVMFVVCVVKACLHLFSIKFYIFRTEPSSWVEVGGIEGQNGVWWPM